MSWDLDETLAKILHPISVAEFYESYFGRRILYIPGERGRFDYFYSVATWRTVPMAETTAVYQTTVDGIPASRVVPILPHQVLQFYDAGLLTVGRIDQLPSLAKMIDGMRASLLFPSGKVSFVDKALCFASKDATGYQLHWDVHHNFIFQIDGQKEWRLGEAPAVDAPLESPAIADAGQVCAEYDGRPIVTPSLESLGRLVLKPGDFLYMPPGVWHAPLARGHSNHVTIALGHRPVYKMISDVIKTEIRNHPKLRRGFPSLAGHERYSGAIPDSIVKIFDEAVEEIRAVLKNLDRRQLHKKWSLEVAEHHHKNDAPRDVQVQRRDRLDRPTAVPIRWCLGRADDDAQATEIFVFAGDGNHVTLPEGARRFVEHMVAAGEFVAEDALGWDEDFDWDSVQAALSSFVAEGILRIVGRAP